MTSASSTGLVFVCEVLADCPLGASAILRSAARADFARSVPNNPHGAFAEGAVGVAFFRA